ncbi:MAG TPA: hypothetical protein VK032_06905, partial [Burkholderiaceae bacterium]|nr:hypothetical protein [Burkholderiaceae bacterium]
MSWVRRWTRRLVLWIGPAIISLLLIALGFLAWVVATQAGSRWAVQTGMHFIDGQASGIQGSIWSGLAIDKLAMALPTVDIDGDQLYLQFNWKELLSRRLHAQSLSAQRLAVQLHETEP